MRTLGRWETIEIYDNVIGILPEPTILELINNEAYKNRNGGFDIAQCYGPDKNYNAALCAAAPELATAIDNIMRHGLTKETRKKANDALKKARLKI